MKKILITGVAGLIGSHLSRYLLDRNYDVFGIDNLSGGYIDFVDNRLFTNRFSSCDLNDIKILNDIFEKFKPDYVYHLAAYAAEGLSPFIRNFNYTNNVLCSVNVINNCINHDVKKIIFTSSMAIYGIGSPPFNEKQDACPVDPYGIAKYTIEMDLKQAYDQFGLKYNIIRPHNIIGIYQNIWDNYRNVIGIWIREILNNKKITIFGDGLQERSFSDIKYYMDPFIKIIDDYDNEIFNIGADKNFKIIDVANLIKDIVKKDNKNAEIEFLEPRNEVKFAHCDHTKSKNILNFEDETNIEKTIIEMYEWAKKQPMRKIKIMDYEINKNMYSFWKK